MGSTFSNISHRESDKVGYSFRTVFEINGVFSRKSQIFPTYLHFNALPHWQVLLEFCNGGGAKKTKVMPLPDSEKCLTICVFVYNVTDGRTDGRMDAGKVSELAEIFASIIQGSGLGLKRMDVSGGVIELPTKSTSSSSGELQSNPDPAVSNVSFVCVALFFDVYSFSVGLLVRNRPKQ